MQQHAGLWVDFTPEIKELSCCIARGSDLPERIMFAVEEFLHRRQRANLVENFLEVFSFRQRRVLAEKHFVLVLCPLKSAIRAGEIWRLDQLVVFEKPNENA